MPTTTSSIVQAAKAEWNYWGQSTWNLVSHVKNIAHRDDDHAFAQYVIDKYCAVGGGSPSVHDIANDEYAWSAVGMSFIMKSAGFSKQEFPFAQSHSVFIRHFIKQRKIGVPAAYWGYRLGEAGGKPAVGDLVAYARGTTMTSEKAKKYFDRTSRYLSHTDVVTAVRSREIDVIGANVLDSVTMKTLSVDASGVITDNIHAWFAVLKKQ